MKVKKKLLLTIIFAALLYLGGCFYAGWDALQNAFVRFDWWVVFPCLALAFMNYCIRFCKWHYYLHLLGIPLRIPVSFKIFLSGLVMSATPGKFGEVFKTFLVKEVNGTELAKSAPIIVAERFTDLIAFILLSLFGITLIPGGRTIDGIILLVMGLVLAVIGKKSWAEGMIRICEGFPFIGQYAHKLYIAYESVARLIAPTPLAIATAISVLSWFMECMAFHLVLWGFDVHLPLIHTTFMYAFATIMGAVLMTPGGIGPTEGTLGGLLVFLHHVPKGIATTATLIIRICTLWFAVIVGLLVLTIYGHAFTTAKSHHFLDEFELEPEETANQ
ncbi:flippase-like domain-containing protein [bacterium]|nr:flippase-like domain-containing protein [bacterium]